MIEVVRYQFTGRDRFYIFLNKSFIFTIDQKSQI